MILIKRMKSGIIRGHFYVQYSNKNINKSATYSITYKTRKACFDSISDLSENFDLKNQAVYVVDETQKGKPVFLYHLKNRTKVKLTPEQAHDILY